MINNYHRNETNYDEQIKLFGLKLLEFDNKVESYQTNQEELPKDAGKMVKTHLPDF